MRKHCVSVWNRLGVSFFSSYFLLPVLLWGIAKSFSQCWISVIFSCSLMDLSADCQRKWIVSLLPVPAFTPSSCLCFSPPFLTPISLCSPFFTLIFQSHLCLLLCVCLHLSFIPPSVSLLIFFFFFLTLHFTSPPSLVPLPHLSAVLSALVEPFVLPSSER